LKAVGRPNDVTATARRSGVHVMATAQGKKDHAMATVRGKKDREMAMPLAKRDRVMETVHATKDNVTVIGRAKAAVPPSACRGVKVIVRVKQDRVRVAHDRE
jgi:phosphopantetheine adenylyltransferase